MTAAQLGLTQGEDLDALIVEPGAGVLFSIAPGAGSYSAADVIFSAGNNGNSLFISAADMSLLATDNIDALATAVPEPMSMALVGTSLLGLMALRRRYAGVKGASMRNPAIRTLMPFLCI
ncbi:MAG: PEP-CTERM sorting domain-containing protein, partial [Deltaproteobacteria bacterium]|nr:PEP-CTERM sorting domain-containing protein [Deltaproteobacteria bacterium]